MTRNFLILDDHAQTGKALALAADLTPHGYVYCAHSGCTEVADTKDQFRSLPLQQERLPRFGTLDAVIVLGSPALAARARQAYPGVPFIDEWRLPSSPLTAGLRGSANANAPAAAKGIAA